MDKKSSPPPAFLTKLQHEAQLQSQLYSHRLLPESLDRMTAFIGRYPWQSTLVVSGLVALAVEVFRYWLYT